MSTTSSVVGFNLGQKVEYVAPEVDYSDPSTKKAPPTKGVVEFMYQTSSANVGESINRGDSRLSQQMDKFCVREEVNQIQPAVVKQLPVVAPRDALMRPEDFSINQIDISAISGPRSEHPMYTTSQRAIGEEKSEVQVENSVRRGIPNAFTNSFNGIKYRNQGLTTAVTKSRVCSELDI